MKRVFSIGLLVISMSLAAETILPDENSLTRSRIWIAKTDSLGELQWVKHYGGALPYCIGSSHNVAQVTSDSGVIITGYRENENDGAVKLLLLKLDSKGDSVWVRTYDREDGGTEYYYFIRTPGKDSSYWPLARNIVGREVVETSDKGFLVLAELNTDSTALERFKDPGCYYEGFQLIKTDSLGEVQWEKRNSIDKNGFGYEIIHQLEGLSDGGCAVMLQGVTDETLNNSPLLRLDYSGNTVWSKIFVEDHIWDVVETSNGNLMVYNTKDTLSRLLVIDSSSEVVDELPYEWGDDYSTEGDVTQEGYVKSMLEEDTLRLLKIDKNGNLLWRRKHPYLRGGINYSIQQTPDDGCIFADVKELTDSRFWINKGIPHLLRFDGEGNQLFERNFPSLPCKSFLPCIWVAQTTDGGYIILSSIYPKGVK